MPRPGRPDSLQPPGKRLSQAHSQPESPMRRECRCTAFVGASGHHPGNSGPGLPYESHRPQPFRQERFRVGGHGNDPRHGSPCARAGGGFCRGIDAGHVPRRRQQSVAGQGNEGAAARAALAVPTKEDAETFTDPRAHFQGRSGARSLEAGHHRAFPDPQDLSDLPVVGRSRAEVAGGRPPGSRGVLYGYARVDESQFQLLSRDQHRLPQQLRQSEQPRRQLAHDPRRLLLERLLCHDRRTDKRDLFAGARLTPRRPAVIPDPGLSVPLDAGESGAASNSSAAGLLADAQDRQRSLRGDASRTQGGCV